MKAWGWLQSVKDKTFTKSGYVENLTLYLFVRLLPLRYTAGH